MCLLLLLYIYIYIYIYYNLVIYLSNLFMLNIDFVYNCIFINCSVRCTGYFLLYYSFTLGNLPLYLILISSTHVSTIFTF